MSDLDAPFPWFGGKSRVAAEVWSRFGADVPSYIEPFFGSGAVLLGRPGGAQGVETVNDLDGFVANAWRAIAADPEAVARWADWPANECDLHARHVWLRERRETLRARLEGDPDYHDPKIAGWWLWGLSQWIGSGFCGESGSGPWVVEEDAEGFRVLVRRGPGEGVRRQRVHLGDAGRGVARKRVHLGNADQGVARDRGLVEWMLDLSARMRRVRVACGDWSRICGPTPCFPSNAPVCGVFLDPPYSAEANREGALYAEEDLTVAHRVREWAMEHGEDRRYRIALCGYEGEHAMPQGWEAVEWKARGGYGSQSDGNGRENAARERIWFSPGCLRPAAQGILWGEA